MHVDYVDDAAILYHCAAEDDPEAAKAILLGREGIGSVLRKASKAEGDRRVARRELLAGDGIVTCRE